MNDNSNPTKTHLESDDVVWPNLPEGIQWSLSRLASQIQENTQELDDSLQKQLQNSLQRYGRMLSQLLPAESSRLQSDSAALENRLTLLRNINIFKGLGDFEVGLLAAQMESIQVPPNVNLLTQDQEADGVYLLEEGQVHVLVNAELVAHRGKGDSFGEMSCIRGEPNASATVRTITDATVLRIGRDQFMRAISRAPKLWQNLFHTMTNRFREVNQRLSEVLQHTPQGLIKIDSLGKITNEFSSQCTEYLGTDRLKGLAFSDVLFADNGVLREGWNQVFPLLFEDISMNFKDIADLLPKEAVFKHPSGQTRYYLMSYYPCRNASGSISAIDIGMENVTRARELAFKSESLEMEKHILTKIYDDPEGYLHLLELVADNLEILQKFMQTLNFEIPMEKHPDWNELLRMLHTMKGVASMFLMQEMKNAAHDLEDYLKILQVEGKSISAPMFALQEKANGLKASAEQARSLVDNMSEELKRRLTGMVLTREEFKDLKTHIQQGNFLQVDDILQKAERIPAKRLFHHWSEETVQLSQKLGKKAKISLVCENVFLPKSLYLVLESTLIHLLRNSLDHGLENPHERKAKDKDEIGLIIVSVRTENQRLIIEIRDDGRGLNEDRIVKKALQNPALDAIYIQQMVQEGTAWKILLLPGFSTAEQVSDISGRGVGMDVVNEVVVKLQGTLTLENEIEKGCQFTISLPFEG